MKNKTKVISIVLFLSVFMMFVSCGKQEAEWKGVIEKENGVTVIKNPKEPFYGEIYLDLEEDLKIGNEADENYQFYRIRDVALDSHLNIYILDAGNHRVQKFDKNGNYLQTIGRKGQGPGEFVRPSNVFINSQDNLYVSEGRRIQIFNSSGNFMKSIPLENSISDFYVDSRGDIFANASWRNEEGRKRVIVKINSEGKIIKTIAEFSDIKQVIKKDSEKVVAIQARHSYTPKLLLSAVDKQAFTYAYSLEYKIFIIDNDGKLLSKIQAEEDSHSISQSEKKHIIGQLMASASRRGRKFSLDVVEEACNFPSIRPFFWEIIVDDLQRIFLWKVKSVLDKSEENEFDVINKEGYFLYRAKIPVVPKIIRKGFLYDIKEDEETGEISIRRFKIKNWDQIKVNI